ncbi:lysylphosphatidylglycerol synthase domain-containing protein [Nocardioides euryhalodurans]|uniref:lysylphosphatidylglycerol synthase domain-containing protein n=1 Tax=Nocardioides euryhalodurans TaxID=2518370 RepID=UPI001421E9F2|nr:lysylphosphatidylglycerol synthase domain-containing protein [Nocardioides euryhalodurans]
MASPDPAVPNVILSQRLRAALQSRTLLVTGILVSLLVPVLTLPRLPEVNLWPVVLGLAPWVAGKYLLCPLRWRAVTDAGLTRAWHVRAYAESELLGLLTPGHVGADVWRVHRLSRTGLRRPDALMSVGLDRLVGALGLTVFIVFAGATLPLEMLAVALGVGVVVLGGGLLLRRFRPDLMPRRTLPPPRRLVHGLLLSAGYQLTIAGLLWGSVAATGHALSPLALLGAFGASQLAGVLPGPHGASPRDGALVVALAALGVPWSAAAAAVALKAVVAWLPALALGGVSLLLTRRALRAVAPTPATA